MRDVEKSCSFIDEDWFFFNLFKGVEYKLTLNHLRYDMDFIDVVKLHEHLDIETARMEAFRLDEKLLNRE